MRAVPALRRRRSYRKKSKHRYKDKRIPLLTVLPILHKAAIEPLLGDPSRGIYGAYNLYKDGRGSEAPKEFVDVIGINFLGRKFSDGSNWGFPFATYSEIALGMAGSWLMNKFGVNKQIKKIPMVGKYIKL